MSLKREREDGHGAMNWGDIGCIWTKKKEKVRRLRAMTNHVTTINVNGIRQHSQGKPCYQSLFTYIIASLVCIKLLEHKNFSRYPRSY